MGAMENDANRCNYLYTDDRRCRNLVESPGIPFCYYHSHKAEKDSHDVRANARAAEAFFDWLSRHPLDTATNLQQALNLLIFLVVSNRISGRQAESLIRVLRLSLKTVHEVHREFRIPELRNHQPEGERFLREIRKTLLSAIRGETEAPLDPAPVPPPTVPDPAPPFPPEPFSSRPVEAPPPARHGGPAPAAASAGASGLEARGSSPGARVAARAPQAASGRPAKVKRNRSAPRPAKHRRCKPRRRLGPASGLANGFAAIFGGMRTAPPSPAGVAKLARAVGKREAPG